MFLTFIIFLLMYHYLLCTYITDRHNHKHNSGREFKNNMHYFIITIMYLPTYLYEYRYVFYHSYHHFFITLIYCVTFNYTIMYYCHMFKFFMFYFIYIPVSFIFIYFNYILLCHMNK